MRTVRDGHMDTRKGGDTWFIVVSNLDPLQTPFPLGGLKGGLGTRLGSLMIV